MIKSSSSSPSIVPWLQIAADDPECLAFWACLFDVSTDRLCQAVAEVGGDVHEVDHFLRREQRMACAA
jgi:hypothetical protein